MSTRQRDANFAVVDADLRATEASIASFHACRRTLRALRNERVPAISRLSSKLLSKIFHIVADAVPDCKEPRVKSLFVLCGVCRSWRVLLRSDPSFWAAPDLRFASLASEMLSLAKDEPLMIDLRKTPWLLRWSSDDAAEVMQRIDGKTRHLQLPVPSDFASKRGYDLPSV